MGGFYDRWTASRCRVRWCASAPATLLRTVHPGVPRTARYVSRSSPTQMLFTQSPALIRPQSPVLVVLMMLDINLTCLKRIFHLSAGVIPRHQACATLSSLRQHPPVLIDL